MTTELNQRMHRMIYEFFEAFEIEHTAAWGQACYMLRDNGVDRYGVYAGTPKYAAIEALYNFLHDGTAYLDWHMAGDGEQAE